MGIFDWWKGDKPGREPDERIQLDEDEKAEYLKLREKLFNTRATIGELEERRQALLERVDNLKQQGHALIDEFKAAHDQPEDAEFRFSPPGENDSANAELMLYEEEKEE